MIINIYFNLFIIYINSKFKYKYFNNVNLDNPSLIYYAPLFDISFSIINIIIILKSNSN